MFWLNMLGILIVITVMVTFYRFTTRLIRIPLKGFEVIWWGIGFIACHVVLENSLPGLTERLSDQYASFTSLVLTLQYALLLLGCVLLLYGAYQLLGSLQNQLKPQYEMLVERSLVGVFRVENNKITYANPRLGEIFGGSRENLVGKDLSDLVHGEDVKLVQDAIENSIAEETPVNIEFRAVHASGRELLIQALGDSVKTVDGQVFQATIQEITGQLRFEEEMRKSEERFRRLLEHSQETVVIHDMGKIEFVNPSGARLLSAENENLLIGKDLLEFFPAESREEMVRHFEDI
ncbi:MAG: PAS domain S-box protein, partial [Calditrichota bacterium]